ncbi:hypothetical protein BV22DRAFT_618821 [Leucogyrophana mollusca]|uniref:Uncharacterized protein n=1 Tax=Leucogyrophana mollusca TaxID=85980 RepID=A0ACB8BBB0_9AGAM|nr:hypothetical protein BV22DRAFT_618821 [Leucogyrophana mollusca]
MSISSSPLASAWCHSPCVSALSVSRWFSDLPLYSSLLTSAPQHHFLEIGPKYLGNGCASSCGSCKGITKIPAGQLHSWSLQRQL